MRTEVDGTAARDVRARAARHAALGDPIRLRITDRLAWGDASPGELAAVLELGSNLLAHHLRVLEGAGLVSRHRSEADRRRSYVSLTRDEATCRVVGANGCHAGPPWAGATRVVFVCTANSARSQLAAALWNQDHPELPAASAGTHPGDTVAPGAVDEASRRGLRLTARPSHLDDVWQAGDVLVTVCDQAHEELADSRPDRPATVHWSVPDPVPKGHPSAFTSVADDLGRRIAAVTILSSVDTFERAPHDHP